MKKITSKLVALYISIGIFVIALAFMICDWAIPISLLYHPVLNFVSIIFIGFGIMALIYGFKRKVPFYFFLSALLLGLVVFYVLFYYLVWWIGLIAFVVISFIISIFSFIVVGNKTEEIALNKSPEYKNYKERQAEKDAIEASKDAEELPEIKSFK